MSAENMSADSGPLEAQGEQTTRPRFGLLTLFYVTAVIAAAIALFGGWGMLWAVAVLGYWLARIRDVEDAIEAPVNPRFRSNSQSGFTWVELLVAIAIIGVLIGMTLPAIGRGYPASFRTSHWNSMRMVGLAICNYEAANGHFPPAYIADENGKPMHSWRVLLLPYLEEEALYKQYDFDEPWDGPNNSKLATKLANNPFGGFWQEPSDGLTGFKLITGPETAFEKDQSVGYGAIAAGSSNTVFLVDDNSKRINWMSPEDVTIEEAVQLFDRKNKKALARKVDEDKFGKTTFYFSNVVMFDGSAHSVGLLEDPAEMRQQFTIANAPEKHLDEIEFEYTGMERETKPDGFILVGVNLSLAFLPWFWLPARKHAWSQA